MVYDFRSSRQPLSTNFCLSISFSLRQRRDAEWTSGGVGVARHRFGARRSLIIFARLDQTFVNRGPKLLVACFPLLLVHVCLRVVSRRRCTAVAGRRATAGGSGGCNTGREPQIQGLLGDTCH